MSITRLTFFWLVISTFTLVAGWLLALHGGVSYESAERAGEASLIYRIEIIFAQFLMWPIFGVLWVWRTLSPDTAPELVREFIVIPAHYLGYGLIFLAYWKYSKRKSKPNERINDKYTAT